MEPTYVTGKPKLWLRLEGLVLLIATVILFAGQGQKWWLYPALLLVPDIFMLGYLANTKLGAFFYTKLNWVPFSTTLATVILPHP